MKNSEKLAWLSADSSNSVFIADDEGVGGQYVKWDTFKECSMEMNEGLRKIWVQNLRDFAEELEDYGKDDS